MLGRPLALQRILRAERKRHRDRANSWNDPRDVDSRVAFEGVAFRVGMCETLCDDDVSGGILTDEFVDSLDTVH
jgi:hypothetical protein